MSEKWNINEARTLVEEALGDTDNLSRQRQIELNPIATCEYSRNGNPYGVRVRARNGKRFTGDEINALAYTLKGADLEPAIRIETQGVYEYIVFKHSPADRRHEGKRPFTTNANRRHPLEGYANYTENDQKRGRRGDGGDNSDGDDDENPRRPKWKR